MNTKQGLGSLFALSLLLPFQSGFAATIDEVCNPHLTLINMSGNSVSAITDVIGGSYDGLHQLFHELVTNNCRILYRNGDEIQGVPSAIRIEIRNGDFIASALISDSSEQEMLLSPQYFEVMKSEGKDVLFALKGVLSHEITHLYQNIVEGMPAGIVEGVADAIRIRSGYPDVNWEVDKSGSWDDGYSKTAFFLIYIDSRSPDFLYRFNRATLKTPGRFWNESIIQDVTGRSVHDWWAEYQRAP